MELVLYLVSNFCLTYDIYHELDRNPDTELLTLEAISRVAKLSNRTLHLNIALSYHMQPHFKTPPLVHLPDRAKAYRQGSRIKSGIDDIACTYIRFDEERRNKCGPSKPSKLSNLCL